MKNWIDFVLTLLLLFSLIVMWSVWKDPYGYSLTAKIGLKFLKLLGLL